MNTDHLLTLRDAAEQAGIAYTRLITWEKAYGFPIVERIGGRMYVQKVDIKTIKKILKMIAAPKVGDVMDELGLRKRKLK